MLLALKAFSMWSLADVVGEYLDGVCASGLWEARLAREFYKDYKAQFSMLPYPPVFVTGDAVVTCAGHLLVVERGGMPGKGLWALPGGFINQKETVEECISGGRKGTCRT